MDCTLGGDAVGYDWDLVRVKHAFYKRPGPIHGDDSNMPPILPRQFKHLDEALSNDDGAAANLVPAHLKQIPARQASEQTRLVDSIQRRILRICETREVGEFLARRAALVRRRREGVCKGLVVIAVRLDDIVPFCLQMFVVTLRLEGDCGLGELENCVFDGDCAVEVEDEIHGVLAWWGWL